ncbi:MAG: phospholipid carrier-dependent glycosyltransferase [Planctomycetota bacterium]
MSPWRPPPELRRAFWGVLLLGLVLRLVLAAEVVGRGTGFDFAHPLDTWLYPAKARLILEEGDYGLARVPDALFRGATTGVPGFFNTPEGRARFLRAGERPLVDAPGYPYLVAASWRLTGSHDPLRVLQVLATLATAYLTFVLARLLGLSGRVAIGAMALVTLHTATVFYAAFLLKPTLITLELLAVCLALACYTRRPGLRPALALGAALGAIHLTKGIVPLALPFLGLGLLWAPASWRARAGHAAAFVAAFLLVCAPLILRGLTHGTGLLHNGQSTYLLFVCNYTGADGLHLVQPPVAYVMERIEGRTSALQVLGAAIDSHPSFWHFLGLLLRKLQGFCSGYEAWNNLELGRDRWLLSSLRGFPLGSWFLIPCGLLGVPFALARGKRLLPLWTGLGVVFVSCMASFVFARYRLPAVPYVAILAALALARLRGRRLVPGALLLALLIGLCSPTALELTRHGDGPAIRGSWSEHEATRALAVRYAPGPNRALTAALLARAARTHPALEHDPARLSREALVDALELHVEAYRACRAAGDEAAAQAVLASVAPLDPSGELRRRLAAEPAGGR